MPTTTTGQRKTDRPAANYGVEERRVNWPILDAWRDAAEQCGIPKIAEFNRGDNFGTAYFQMNQRRGVRVSASKAFLRPAMSRANLTVMTGRVGGTRAP